MHDFPLITTLAAAFTAAWILGLMTQKIGLSPIVGYLLAGVLIGPYTPGFVGDVKLAPQLAELGVILLMFGVGLHFHVKDLLAVKSIAIPGAIGQSLVATVAGAVVFGAFGWPLTAGLVMGMAMAVASTVVLMRVLMDSGRFTTPAGHAAVGWLIVEDILTVVVLVLIPAIAPAGDTGHGAAAHGWLFTLLAALGKLVVLVALVSFAGAKAVPWVLVQVARLRSRELFTLTVLVLSIAVATGSAVFFGASVALGAFLAGMVVAQSPVSQQAGADALPLRDAFAVLFFVSVGMLFDPRFVVQHPSLIVGGIAIVLLVKPVAALVIVAAIGYPASTSLTVAVGLAQIGEFSFILGELAAKHGLIPEEGRHLLVACALVSITINPLLFRIIGPAECRLRRMPLLWKMLTARSRSGGAESNTAAISHIEGTSGPLAIIVGYGPVGRQMERLLRQANLETVVIDLNMDTISFLKAQNRTAIFGDAASPEILEQAGAARASHIVISTTGIENRQSLIAAAKALNPQARVLIRTHYLREEAEVCQAGANAAVVDEVESAVALAEMILAETGADASKIRTEARRVRHELTAPDRPTHA